MNHFYNLFKKENMGQLILTILFLIYLIMGYNTPLSVAELVDTPIGKLAVIIVALCVLSTSNPILGILGLFVAYELIRRSMIKLHGGDLQSYIPSESKKNDQYSSFNQNEFPYTLEQEVVQKMTIQNNNINISFDGNNSNFKPILDDTHDASPLNVYNN
jgi:hypothetical protein